MKIPAGTTPVVTVAVTWAVTVSKRITVPSPRLVSRTASPSATIVSGFAPTGYRPTT